MKVRKHIQKFFLKTWDATGILVAFCPISKSTNAQNLKIAESIYNRNIKNGHLGLTDAETIYQYIKKLDLDYDKDSLVLCEFNKNDNLIENIFGDKINTSYEKAGSELRFYFNGMSNLAFTVTLKTNSIFQKLLWWIVIAILGIGVLCLVDRYLDLQKAREENRQHENSIEQARLQKADLSAKLDSVIALQIGANEELSKSKVSVTRKQEEIDSVTRALHDKEEELEALKQQVKSTPKKHTDAPPQKQKTQQAAKPAKVTRNKKEENFKALVDRGNQYARSYQYKRSESDRVQAIRCYEKALEIRSDKDIHEKLSKLQKK